jgi:hypothetical protein
MWRFCLRCRCRCLSGGLSFLNSCLHLSYQLVSMIILGSIWKFRQFLLSKVRVFPLILLYRYISERLSLWNLLLSSTYWSKIKLTQRWYGWLAWLLLAVPRSWATFYLFANLRWRGYRLVILISWHGFSSFMFFSVGNNDIWLGASFNWDFINVRVISYNTNFRILELFLPDVWNNFRIFSSI